MAWWLLRTIKCNNDNDDTPAARGVLSCFLLLIRDLQGNRQVSHASVDALCARHQWQQERDHLDPTQLQESLQPSLLHGPAQGLNVYLDNVVNS
jgi:hypothetical protein